MGHQSLTVRGVCGWSLGSRRVVWEGSGRLHLIPVCVSICLSIWRERERERKAAGPRSEVIIASPSQHLSDRRRTVRTSEIPHRSCHKEIFSASVSCCAAQFFLVRPFREPMDTAKGMDSKQTFTAGAFRRPSPFLFGLFS